MTTGKERLAALRGPQPTPNQQPSVVTTTKGRGGKGGRPVVALDTSDSVRFWGQAEGAVHCNPPPTGVPCVLIGGECQDVLASGPPTWADVIVADPGVGASESLPGWRNQSPGPEIFAQILRAAKPGAHMALFGGTRHYHKAVTYAEEAGWEMRQVLAWHYAKGMTMSIDVGQAVARNMGEEATPYFRTIGAMTDAQRSEFLATSASNPWWGWGTEIRPSTELIAIMRRPLNKSSVANSVMAYGTGAFNIDAARIKGGERDAIATHFPDGQGDAHGLALQKFQAVVGTTTLGRWPADAIFEHHSECGNTCHPDCAAKEVERQSDGASAFFYCPKSPRSEKDLGGSPKSNTHKVIKPLRLLDWTLSLLTPPGGVVLDPFCGTATTGLAAARRGVPFIGIDRDPRWLPIAQQRLMAVDQLSY